jgi:hypothetical protein
MIVLPMVVQNAPNAPIRTPTARITLRDSFWTLRSGFQGIRSADVDTGDPAGSKHFAASTLASPRPGRPGQRAQAIVVEGVVSIPSKPTSPVDHCDPFGRFRHDPEARPLTDRRGGIAAMVPAIAPRCREPHRDRRLAERVSRKLAQAQALDQRFPRAAEAEVLNREHRSGGPSTTVIIATWPLSAMNTADVPRSSSSARAIVVRLAPSSVRRIPVMSPRRARRPAGDRSAPSSGAVPTAIQRGSDARVSSRRPDVSNRLWICERLSSTTKIDTNSRSAALRAW